VVAHEHDLDALVVALEKQVQQDEEPLRQVLPRFAHGTGHIHNAEHHCLCNRHRLRHPVSVTQVETVDERHTRQVRLQRLAFCKQRRDLRIVGVRVVAAEPCDLVLYFAQSRDLSTTEGNPAR